MDETRCQKTMKYKRNQRTKLLFLQNDENALTTLLHSTDEFFLLVLHVINSVNQCNIFNHAHDIIVTWQEHSSKVIWSLPDARINLTNVDLFTEGLLLLMNFDYSKKSPSIKYQRFQTHFIPMNLFLLVLYPCAILTISKHIFMNDC